MNQPSCKSPPFTLDRQALLTTWSHDFSFSFFFFFFLVSLCKCWVVPLISQVPNDPKVYYHSQDNLAGGRELENKAWKKNTDISDLPTAL